MSIFNINDVRAWNFQKLRMTKEFDLSLLVVALENQILDIIVVSIVTQAWWLEILVW